MFTPDRLKSSNLRYHPHRNSFRISVPHQEPAPEKKKKKVKQPSLKSNKKASFRRLGSKVGVKAPAPSPPLSDPDRDEDSFGGYDLKPLPKEAYPDMDRANKGKRSYTIEFSGARVEVLLDKKAFFIKKCAVGSPGPVGQITWGKYGGPLAAWKLVKERCGINRPAEPTG